MKYTKPHLPYEDQVDLLTRRGLIPRTAGSAVTISNPDMGMSPEDVRAIGVIVGAHGLQGTFKLASLSDFPERFEALRTVYLLRGETVHAAHIGEAVSRALMEIQIAHEVPVVHEVLLLENEGQARVRCLNPKHNRGTEAAQTALAMARAMKGLDSESAF